ncbi:unnamed protein product [Rangifer tarandus platyrhynchus]|uniref:Uncharacterized protein n=2 Tax=Rangifer tarandus platyrhynchus TaxID=3082113 RepID=A0ACB0E6G4_RANTA|nr:unnamed protein product [Rangifer tarandus platyrhynchus]CAI9696039.1 unnamed protein product [Rangifer tarandus platyrhynchus]
MAAISSLSGFQAPSDRMRPGFGPAPGRCVDSTQRRAGGAGVSPEGTAAVRSRAGAAQRRAGHRGCRGRGRRLGRSGRGAHRPQAGPQLAHPSFAESTERLGVSTGGLLIWEAAGTGAVGRRVPATPLAPRPGAPAWSRVSAWRAPFLPAAARSQPRARFAAQPSPQPARPLAASSRNGAACGLPAFPAANRLPPLHSHSPALGKGLAHSRKL